MLPSVVRVGFREYLVQQWKPLSATSARRLGECDHLELVIRIREDLAPALQAETLLHEVLHCAFWTGGIEDKDDEERTVSVLSTQLAQIWRDNPKLVAFLSAALDAQPGYVVT